MSRDTNDKSDNREPTPTNDSAELDESTLEQVLGGNIVPLKTIYYQDPTQPDDPTDPIIFNPTGLA